MVEGQEDDEVGVVGLGKARRSNGVGRIPRI